MRIKERLRLVQEDGVESENPGMVHISNIGLVDLVTLCGEGVLTRTTWTEVPATTPVTCRACYAIWEGCKGLKGLKLGGEG